MKAAIEWKRTADELPDADETLLIAEIDGDVWIGWLDGDQWRDVLATPIDPPTHWAHMPEAPGA